MVEHGEQEVGYGLRLQLLRTDVERDSSTLREQRKERGIAEAHDRNLAGQLRGGDPLGPLSLPLRAVE